MELRTDIENSQFKHLCCVKQDEAKYCRIKQLQAQGKTLSEIAQEYRYSDKSGVSRWLSRYERDYPECKKSRKIVILKGRNTALLKYSIIVMRKYNKSCLSLL